ncbi:MAG: hypothetical protein HRU69_08465 [Flammeovirgaceae bacterium]|nr:MAG: hypothetical protein HRU69_08465 [Flammeovirgaceae bacterium]
MQYQSASEYFYKLYARLFVLVLVPLIAFLFLFLAVTTGHLSNPLGVDGQSVVWLRYVFLFVFVADWTLAFQYYRRSLKPVRTLVSLADRLNRYYYLVSIRFVIIITGLVLLAAGYYLLADEVLAGIFITSLLLLVLIWPFPGRVASHLHLKGDEQRWVRDWK